MLSFVLLINCILMDLYKLHMKRKTGFVSKEAYIKMLQYESCFNTYSQCDFDMIPTVYSSPVGDYSICKNRLLMAHTDCHVSLYDVSKPINSRNNFLRLWSTQSKLQPGLESINWHSSGDVFTISASDRILYSIDVENMTVIDRIDLKKCKQILQHKPSPHDNATIAVASLSPKVILVDMRSGNITCTSNFHSKGVLSVTWSGLNENLLVTAGDNCTCFWDIRRFRRPMLTNKDNCIISVVLPNFEVVPNTDEVIMLNVDRDITIWNVHKLEKVSHFGPFIMPFAKQYRYKFALAGQTEPGLIFMPADYDIRVYKLQDMEIIATLEGHVLPVQAIFFCNLSNQLYSSALDGSFAWGPTLL